MSNLFKQNSIDIQTDDAEDHGLDVDTATDVAAKFFNDLPLRVSFTKAAHIEAQADMAMRLEGAENFTNAALLRNQPGRDVDDDNEDDHSASRTSIRAAVDELKRLREREREEWSRTRSTVGSVTMTGTEWAALSQLMRSDNEFRQKLLDAFMARGMTLDEAEERYDRVADVADIARIPPPQRTEEQNHIISEASADPSFRQDVAQTTSFMDRLPNARSTSGLADEFENAASNNQQPLAPTQAAPQRQVIAPQGLGI